MKYENYEIVVLETDVPDHGLKCGDTGTVVELYEPDGVEVEFVNGTGKTKAVLTLKESDIRHLGDNDILAVRPVNAA
jgi:hypothetical protein